MKAKATTKRKTFQSSPDMIGKYVNRYLFSDIIPVGRVVGIKSKTILIVQPIEAKLINSEKLEFNIGGFVGHCTNQDKQRYEFKEASLDPYEYKMPSYPQKGIRIESKPVKFYDYNF